MSSVELPADLDSIDAPWLDAALREHGVLDVEVEQVRVEPLGPGHGLLGDKARLFPTYRRGDGPTSMLAKLPASAAGSREVGLMLNVWAREVEFYRHIAPNSNGTRLARCYYAGADPSRQRWVLLLEDCPADAIEFQHGTTVAQSAAAIDALADFHARWWAADTDFDWMPGFDRGGVGSLQPAWLDSLPVFLERFADHVPAPTGDWVSRFAHQLDAWSRRAGTEPITMVHADYRADNVLFNGDDVTIIDWQTALRGPAAMDVSSFLTTSLDIDLRRANEPALLDRYLDRLATNGVNIDREWFLRSYDECILWWMGQFGNNLARLYPDAATQANLDLTIERVYTAALDRNVGRLLEP